ncbi:hypothetical protein FACS1894211_11030 [Clostridia bacterium]|nr:hypothetical protein FACS1894211_11030 [Clostridia bacterium]
MDDTKITKLKTLVCVVNPGKERDLVAVLTDYGAFGFYEFRAEGMVSSEILSLLGLADNKRIMFVCLARAEDMANIRAVLEREIYAKPGDGVAFVVNVDGFIGARTLYRLAREEFAPADNH